MGFGDTEVEFDVYEIDLVSFTDCFAFQILDVHYYAQSLSFHSYFLPPANCHD